MHRKNLTNHIPTSMCLLHVYDLKDLDFSWFFPPWLAPKVKHFLQSPVSLREDLCNFARDHSRWIPSRSHHSLSSGAPHLLTVRSPRMYSPTETTWKNFCAKRRTALLIIASRIMTLPGQDSVITINHLSPSIIFHSYLKDTTEGGPIRTYHLPFRNAWSYDALCVPLWYQGSVSWPSHCNLLRQLSNIYKLVHSTKSLWNA